MGHVKPFWHRCAPVPVTKVAAVAQALEPERPAEHRVGVDVRLWDGESTGVGVRQWCGL